MTKALILQRFTCMYLMSRTVSNHVGYITVIHISKKEAHAQSLRPNNAMEYFACSCQVFGRKSVREYDDAI